MKTVAVLVQNLHNGGAERMAANLSLELSKHYRVYMIVFDGEGAIYPCGGKLIDLKVPPIVKGSSLKRIGNTILRVRKLRYLKKKLSIDCCISHMEGANLVNILSRRGDKVLCVYHSMPSMCESGSFLNKCLHRFIGQGADRYLTVSKPAEEDMADSFGVDRRKLGCIYNFCDLEKIASKKEEPLDDRSEAFYKMHNNVIVHAGRMIPLKAQHRLIEVCKRLRDEGMNSGLVILGEGEERKRLEKLASSLGIKEHVFMPGEVENPFPYIKRADVFALCSVFEGLPMVLIEALSCGCPVVSMDMKSGAREILAPGTDVRMSASDIEYARYGILTPPCGEKDGQRELELFYQAVKQMLCDEKLRAGYLKLCREGAERFSAESVGGEWRELIG
ncbi:MAG: glycosyltransferase [Lachnospiraceae bacterium]|nr:glycosyltransferase [Lachnospiraceae bacterium]